MPLWTAHARPRDRRPYVAVIAVPAFNAASTIESTLASAAASVRAYRTTPGAGPVAISVVDDASTDGTPDLVRAFGKRCDQDVYLTVQPLNAGRACARNLAVTVVDAPICLFLDHDDRYEPTHVLRCLEALDRHPGADFVKTRVRLSHPVHPDWEPRIAASLTQNLCVRMRVHRLIGGFQEEPEVEAYGCDDQLYNRTLRACFIGVDVPAATVTFVRRPGNSFDRQYEPKFTRPASGAEVTLTPEQLRLQPMVRALHDRRLAEVHARLARIEWLGRRLRPAPRRHTPGDPREHPIQPQPFSNEGERIFALMVTGKGPERARLACASVRSFLLQEYGNRALVVVNDGPFDVDVSAIPIDRVTVVRPGGRRPLGDLRNLGLDAVPDGSLWTYWDDDDWRHPKLMGAQRAMLARMAVPACFLSHQVRYGFARDVAVADYHPGGFAGTLMAVKHPLLRFPPVASGEDSAYTAALKESWPWTSWQNPPHYFLRFVHGANTCHAAHFGLDDEPDGRWQLGPAARAYLRSVLPFYREPSRRCVRT